MSFISIKYASGPHQPYNHLTYTLVDDEFGSFNITVPVGPGAAIVKFYSERNLPVGRNLALFHLYWNKNHLRTIKQSIQFHDERSPAHIPNWSQYAKERDKYLEKLLPLL